MIVVEERKYCAVDAGKKTHSQAISHCENLNAGLPLPESETESKAFTKAFPKVITNFSMGIWIYITDPGKISRFTTI